MIGVDSSREDIEENQTRNHSTSSWRLDTELNTHPPIPSTVEIEECSKKAAPPSSLNLRKQYSQICTTHKKLVKSGAVKCSVSLTETPPTVDLPSAPTSPTQTTPLLLLEGSVHFGAVGDFSGVQTPDPSPAKSPHSLNVRGVSVIRSAPPPLPPRNPILGSVPLLHPKPGLSSSYSGVIHHSKSKISTSEIVQRRRSSTDPALLENRKIPIVSTSVSSLESYPEVFRSKIPPSVQVEQQEEDQSWQIGEDQSIMDMFQDEAKELMKVRRRLVRRMDEFVEDDINTSRISVMERDLDRISDMKDNYQDGVEDFIDRYRDIIDEPSVLVRWTQDVSAIGQEVKAHADKIRTKAAVVMSTNSRSLEIQEAALKIQELSLKEQQVANSDRAREKAEEGIMLADTEANLLLGECKVLGDMMILETDWTEAADEVVANAMRHLDKWQEQMNHVERAYRKYENSAIKYSFPEHKQEATTATYEEYREKFEALRDDVKREDAERELFTLEPVRSDIIKYPSFSGLPSEDYLKFKETMGKRFRENKVNKKEQVAKLRECLKGAALGRVPDGVTDIEEAFRRLNEAFGNPSKVMTYNLKALEDLGTLPPEKLSNGQYNYAKQIEWFLKFEVILGKILDLSGRSSKLAHEAFASSTYRKIWARFPPSLIQKLVKVQGEDDVRMEGILNKIVKMREQAQVMDDECGSTTASSYKKKTDPPKVMAELFFRPAQRYDECRICVHLAATSSNHQDLFENHLSNYATGCPKFMEATTELRKTLSKKVKLCPQCFHPDVIFLPGHLKECFFSKKKNKYSCKDDSCKDHMWICLTHKQKNKVAMEQFRKDMRQKGHNLAFSSYIPLQFNQADSPVLNNAVRKLRRNENKKGREIVPVPEGEPLFLFHDAQGKTEPVKTFYDSGCSHAVFKEGIPGKQLRGQLVAKGPFNIGGVAGLTTKALDEWVVSVPRADGKVQHIQGLTVPRITSDFPHIDLVAATRDIKDDDLSNEHLQHCRVPPMAGGTVDMLLGIKYNSVFPKEVHTLPCGLTIYQSRLASHGGKFDSCIGGPHSSFTVLAGLAGGTAELIMHFMEGLKVFRQWGPPKIPIIAMCEDDIDLARKFNASEDDMMMELVQLEDLEYLELHNSVDEDNELDTMQESSSYICCSHCPTKNNALVSDQCIIEVSHDERIKEFKKFQKIQESGLEVDYRCPKCRDCIDCKAADKTEKISIREECEMHEIRKSVTLDFENKRIQCSLPLRGKERDFLSNNRDKAMKILNQQCKKYHKDTETKVIILKAFAKLFDNGHAKLLTDLSEEELKMFIDKEVQHHIPWRVVFSGSATTPCRPVMDASSRTAYRADKSGGRCLNDLVCKGKIDSLNLVKVLLRFTIGRSALTGDLQQFYNSCKLNKDQWNLQRFLWVDDLDPDGEILEAVITTLMYGVKSVACQSEHAVDLLAELAKTENPVLAIFLILSRYVDDLQDSKSTTEECVNLAESADELFARVGLKCKAWTISGSPPSQTVSKDGLSVGVFGSLWFPEGDILEQRFARLHFGKSRRGRVPDSVKFFEGNSEEDMDKFVPDNLTRRQVSSKYASWWDIRGIIAPFMPGPKLDLRETFQRTEGWDETIPTDLRQRWVKNFWMIEQLRGLKYSRAVMPADAVNCDLRLLTGVDAAKDVLMMGCWGGFLMPDGSYSNQLILGRSLLSKNESIPKSELDALCGGSNMAWVVRLALKEWVKNEIIFSDSMIALCWLTSEKLRLSLFHRNRVLQIRRGTELENVYHVRTEHNPADCGTRPVKVKLTDVGPGSRWETGDSWMNLDIEEAVSRGYIKPATKIRVSKDLEEDFKEGLIFGDTDEVLTRGHTVSAVNTVSETRIKKLEERANVSNYLFLPTKFKFPATVRIYGYVLGFVKNARRGRKMVGELLKEAKVWFSAFSCDLLTAKFSSVKVLTKVDTGTDMTNQTKVLGHFAIKKLVFNTDSQKECLLNESFLHMALLYLFRKSTVEVKHFNSKKILSKIASETDGILLSKGRLLDGMNFVETGDFGDFNLGSLGIKVNIPLLDRFSPLSYSIAQHIHWTVGRHRGIETNNRLSLEHVSIMQGMTLFRELADECVKCHMKRKKFLQVPMGPVAQEQLMVAPPFYITMIDLFGPMRSFVPGFERNTRGRRELETKLYIMVGVCITTKIVNLQALEDKSAPAIIDGFTRLSAEVGIPTMVHIDQDSGALAGFRTAELDFRDLQHQLHTQFGISFTTCPKGGHDQHGLVERIIKSLQETFEDCGLQQKRLHATGWQTFCKLAENAYNNLPFGYSFSRYQDNTELLKILTPNMLRVGKMNRRALQGPIRLPVDKKEILERVEKTYQGWFKIFKETVVPRLISQPKWFKIDRDLKEKDLVYFQKNDSPLSSTWTIGQVDQVVVSRDGYIRRAVVKYYNSGENHPQFTDRAVRKLVKLWSIDEVCLFDDLVELQRRLDVAEGRVDGDPADGPGQGDEAVHGDDAGAVGNVSDRTAAASCLEMSGTEVFHVVGTSDASQASSVQYCGGCSPIMTSTIGYCGSSAQAGYMAGPSYVTLDDIELDLTAMAMPCDLTPLLVQHLALVEDQAEPGEGDSEDQPDVNLDSLHNIIVSTGFVLG